MGNEGEQFGKLWQGRAGGLGVKEVKVGGKVVTMILASEMVQDALLNILHAKLPVAKAAQDGKGGGGGEGEG